MNKIFILSALSALLSLTSSAQMLPITGPSGVCTGVSATLLDSSSTGGTWSSSNTAIASISSSGSTFCNVVGVAAGTAVITFTAAAGYVVHPMTVSIAPAAITGTTSICVGSTSTLADPTPGGTWSSGSSSIASVNAATGVVTGISAGVTTIAYGMGTGCYASTSFTVSGGPHIVITGPVTVCVGSIISLSDTAGASGGTWTSSSTAVATVVATGSATAAVTGVTAGTVIISYTLSGPCGTSVAIRTITVSSSTSAGTIMGATGVTVGASTSLSGTVGGGTWSSSNTSVASIDATGSVTGIAPGTATISYAVTGCGGTVYATHVITVTAFNGISGHVLFTGASYRGWVKLYLITYDPSTYMLQAVDSASVLCTSGTSVYYQFTGCASDTFRVKASVNDTSSFSIGYIPTYHNSSFYWYSATTFYHTSGTSDINKDITMLTGTPSSGPGFVGGSVLTGANRGTTGGIPVKGLSMNILNASTSQLMQQVRTDASGNYSFSNLPVGTYFVFPDSLNYLTTPFTSITLTSGTPTVTTASFIQHTISHTITPIETGIKNVINADATVIACPNPTNGKLNVLWNEPSTEVATISVSDMAGKVIYTTSTTFEKGAGMKQIDLSNLSNGLYLISIKSDAINYNNKLQVQH